MSESRKGELTSNIDSLSHSSEWSNSYILLRDAIKSNKQREVIQRLLTRGSRVNRNDYELTDTLENTPLHYAVFNNDIEIVKMLLQRSANIEAQNSDGKTPLHIAAQKGYCEIAEYLLKSGADANVNMFGSRKMYTPLHSVTISKLENIAALLINNGANVNAKDEYEKSPILYAIENADLKITKLLLTNGADIKDKPELLNITVEKESIEIIELLLQYGANINASDEYGKTALHCTAFIGNENRKANIAKLLLSRGANVNAKNIKDETPLCTAIAKNKAKVVEALLQYNANVNLSNNDITPLHLSGSNEVITTMLLNKGAHVNAKKNDGTTPLHIAVRKNYKNTVEVLLNYGAKVDAKFKGNKTSIHLAAELNHVEITDILLKYGADVDSKDNGGRTALHLASKRYNKEAVVTLLESGADVNIINKTQSTPIERNWCSNGEIFQEHLIKMKSANLYLHTNNLEIIGNIDNSDLWNKCKTELESMKNEKIGIVSFHDILTKNINQMAHYAKNENIIQTLKSDYYKTKFPIYANMIKNNFKKAVVRMELLEKVRTFIKLPLPYICTEKIFSYISTENLKELFGLATRDMESVFEIHDSDSDSSFDSTDDSIFDFDFDI